MLFYKCIYLRVKTIVDKLSEKGLNYEGINLYKVSTVSSHRIFTTRRDKKTR